MDIGEVMELKRALEGKILRDLQEFKDETGLCPECLSLEVVTARNVGYPEERHLSSLSIEVKI